MKEFSLAMFLGIITACCVMSCLTLIDISGSIHTISNELRK